MSSSGMLSTYGGLSLAWNSLIRLDCWPVGPRAPPGPSPEELYRFWGLNSVFHACELSTLLTEPS